MHRRAKTSSNRNLRMPKQQVLTGKQAKRIVRHIENHIKEYPVNHRLELTDQDLREYRQKLKEVVQITNSPGAQRKAAWTYELVEKIQYIRRKIHQVKLEVVNGKKE